MKTKFLMIQGTSSGSGKSILVTALCRIFANKGYKVSPFKPQNMSNYISTISNSNKIVANAQAIQSAAARVKPDPRINPILLKPIGNYQSMIYLNGTFYSIMTAHDYYTKFVLNKGFKTVLNSFNELKEKHDIVLIEGAGSPSEINIQKYDIANMIFAKKINSPVILVSDIERGGCFASILGTLMLLKPSHRNLIKGVLINKFLGDSDILYPAIKQIESKIHKPFLGIIPKIDHNIPQEDSLDNNKIKKNGIRNPSKHKTAITSTTINDSPSGLLNESMDTNMAIKGELNLEILEKEIDMLVKKIEPSIDIKYILKNILK